MAEANEILQLGIEAARDGNREEARNLFTLLTKQEPQNIQAWLWLAGVSDNPKLRRDALERAIAIDPQNEMALRGLRALGADRPSLVDRGRNAIRERTGQLLGRTPERPSQSPARQSQPSARPSQPNTRQSRPAVQSAPAADSVYAEDELTAEFDAFAEEYDDEPRGPTPLMWGVLGALALLLIVFLASQFFGNSTASLLPANLFGATSADSTPTPDAAMTATAIATMTPAGPPTATPPPVMLLNRDATLTQDGWEYGLYPDPSVVNGPISLAGIPPKGTYLIVLVTVANNTGKTQPLPANFFGLLDDQGRRYDVNVERSMKVKESSPGSADLGISNDVEANGTKTSIVLIYDVNLDATNLRLYGGTNLSQGWVIVDKVQ
jgi:hypothetical protein